MQLNRLTLSGIQRQLPRLVVASCMTFSPAPVFAQTTVTMAPADVYVLVDRVGREVELLRYTMGKPVNQQPPMEVEDVQPHEAFFQAQNLFRKTNRLARELAGSPRKTPPVAPEVEIVAQDVHGAVTGALEELLTVKAELGISETVSPRDRERSDDLTEVFRAIVQVNRQLNLMTEHVFVPGDVYGQVLLATSYAAGMLLAYPEEQSVPELPVFETGMMPADAYRRLVDCLRLTRQIAEIAEFQLLRFETTRRVRTDVLPSDVYDLATILVSYIGHLALRLDAPEAYPDLSTPEHVFPSHVYQRAGALHQQLSVLVSRRK